MLVDGKECMDIGVTATLRSGKAGIYKEYVDYFENSYLYKDYISNEEVADAYSYIKNNGINNWEHLFNIMNYLDDYILNNIE